MQVVPLKTRSRASSSEPLGSVHSAERATGTDSPVSVEVSTSIVPDSRRASAEMRSPSSMTMTSPGTSCPTSTVWRDRSRSTCTCAGMYSWSASTARSACSSWKKANTAFSTITTTIAIATASIPATHANPAAAHSRTRAGA